MIVKCQDEVSSNRNRLTHVQIINYYIERIGFDADVDLFVLMRQSRPYSTGIKRQVHARKNHSLFLVFRKGRHRGGRDHASERHPPARLATAPLSATPPARCRATA